MKRLFFALVAFISLATSVFADKAISRTTVRPENIMSVALVDGKPVILAIEDGKFYIYDDGKKSEPYDDNRNFFVSDNGKILLCVMKKDDETFIFHGKKKYGPYPLFDEPYESYILAFSKDGKTVYHQAKADDGSRIVYKNGKEIRRLHSKLYNNIIHSPEFDRIIPFVDGESETEQYIYHEGKRFGPYGDTLVSAISIEGKDRIFYSAKTKEGWFIFGENEKIGPYDEVSISAYMGKTETEKSDSNFHTRQKPKTAGSSSTKERKSARSRQSNASESSTTKTENGSPTPRLAETSFMCMTTKKRMALTKPIPNR